MTHKTDPTPAIYAYEMGYSVAEFSKTLHGQFTSSTPYSCQQSVPLRWLISVDNEKTTVDIQIIEAEPRNIGMLTLPVLKVNFEFINSSKQQQDEFLSTFFKYFHKGGG